MNIRDDIKELKTDATTLRKFGLVVGSVFVLLGVIFLLRHKAHWPYFVWPGVALMVLGAVLPRLLRLVYLAWMTLAVLLGFVVSHVLLTLFFFLIMLPIGLIARLAVNLREAILVGLELPVELRVRLVNFQAAVMIQAQNDFKRHEAEGKNERGEREVQQQTFPAALGWLARIAFHNQRRILARRCA